MLFSHCAQNLEKTQDSYACSQPNPSLGNRQNQVFPFNQDPHIITYGLLFHFGTHKDVIGGRSPPWYALWNRWYTLWNRWYTLYKIWYIVYKIWYILYKIWYIFYKICYIESYYNRDPYVITYGPLFHFKTHKEVIGGRSSP